MSEERNDDLTLGGFPDAADIIDIAQHISRRDLFAAAALAGLLAHKSEVGEVYTPHVNEACYIADAMLARLDGKETQG